MQGASEIRSAVKAVSNTSAIMQGAFEMRPAVQAVSNNHTLLQLKYLRIKAFQERGAFFECLFRPEIS